ncbi:MAG: YceI family protein [Bacteroidota bacterium]
MPLRSLLLTLVALVTMGAAAPVPVHSLATPLPLDLRASRIEWTVSKVGKDYRGLVSLADARLDVSDSTLAGYLLFDINAATCTNATGPELDEVMEVMHERLFDTARHPRGHLLIQDARPVGHADAEGVLTFEVTGDLRVRGQSQRVTFPVRVRPHAQPGAVVGEATLTIERARWGLHYGTSLVDRMKDQAIADTITFHAVFVAG